MGRKASGLIFSYFVEYGSGAAKEHEFQKGMMGKTL